MTEMFKSGFETGDFGDFNAREETLGVATIATFPRVGVYSGKFTTQPTLELAYARARVNISAPEVYARGYFYIAKGVEALGTHDRFYLIRIEAADGYLANIGIRREADAPARWSLAYRGGHTYGSLVEATPRWVCIEVHWTRLTNVLEVFIDGKLDISFSVDTSANPNATIVRFGVTKIGATGLTYDPTTEYPIEVYVDECVIADEYIGVLPEVAPPIPWWQIGAVATAVVVGVAGVGYILKRKR